MTSGAQNAYMQLQAMPSAAPHIELPLYQNEYASIANRPDRANMGKAGLIRAARVTAGSALPSPPDRRKHGEDHSGLKHARRELPDCDSIR